MPLNRNTVLGLVFVSVSGSAFCATNNASAIGMASASSSLMLNDTKISGNASLFEGSSLQTEGYSRIRMNNGSRMDLGEGAKIQLFADHASLSRGMTEVQSPSGFEIQAQSLTIRTSEAASIARIRVQPEGKVYVTALNGSVNVLNRQGLVVARVKPGLPMSFMPQASSSSSFDNTGCVVNKSGAALLVDQTGNQVFELRGFDMRKGIGNTVHVTGMVNSSATPASGANQVVTVSSATTTSRGGCAAVATKLGASTTAAGLASAVGAGATGGAVAASGAAAGAAAGAAGAGAAAAGLSTTALVVGGVAAATAAAVGGAAAAGSFSGSSN